ncbi:c-type cytochrome [Guyparkeria sp.]|uniref:c-type cytochrome n=1 Tax=Guyparkeria sp. TaxID=2035736 RepID=UPI003561D8AC
MFRKLILPIALAATVATTQGVAQAADPADVIEYRQAVFQVAKNNFGPIADMLKGEIEYDQATVEKNAAVVQMMSTLVGDLFPEGTDAMAGETNALTEIWDEPDAFADKVAKFEETSSELVEAADSGDKRQLAAAVKDVGSSCKACHDDFRRDD